jgi:hypothetical protein
VVARLGLAGILRRIFQLFELRVRALTGPALAGVRGIDLPLGSGQPSVAAGVRIEPAAPLRSHATPRSDSHGVAPAMPSISA